MKVCWRSNRKSFSCGSCTSPHWVHSCVTSPPAGRVNAAPCRGIIKPELTSAIKVRASFMFVFHFKIDLNPHLYYKVWSKKSWNHFIFCQFYIRKSCWLTFILNNLLFASPVLRVLDKCKFNLIGMTDFCCVLTLGAPAVYMLRCWWCHPVRSSLSPCDMMTSCPHTGQCVKQQNEFSVTLTDWRLESCASSLLTLLMILIFAQRRNNISSQNYFT